MNEEKSRFKKQTLGKGEMTSNDEWICLQLGRFANDLWIERRLAVTEAIKCLEDARPEANKANDWLIFLRFLEAECTGRDFASDKQWGELLNLMQISRKLNHRTVKFRDIMKNKQVIEANELAIKRLNESARLAKRIEEYLDELDSLVVHCNLDLVLGDNTTNVITESVNSLTACRDYLGEKCQPLVRAIRTCIEHELSKIHGHTRLDLWRQRLLKHELIINRLVQLLYNLRALKSKLFHLSPLMSASNSIGAEERTSGKIVAAQQLENTISKCRQQFEEVREFCNSLDESINKLSSKRVTQQDKKKLPLTKLLNTRGEYALPELNQLERTLKDLDRCGRNLDEIMRKLRLEFGRFYFVNDLELLAIIALDWRLATCKSQESKDLLSKLFSKSISSFAVDPSGKLIVGVESPLGEVVVFSEKEGPIEVRKQVNLYSVEIVRILINAVRKMRRSLKFLLLENLKGCRDSVDFALPVQVMNLAEYIRFTQRVEAGLNATTDFDEIIKFYEKRLFELGADKTDKVDYLMTFKKSAAISMTVHFLSVLMSLKSNNVRSTKDWRWLKQVRYYAMQTGDIVVKIADAEFVYKFDFLHVETNSRQEDGLTGSYKRLIMTQTTERCFLVASQAVGNFRLGASLQGPAGGGKTESIKALGHLLGCQVIVHNCDETNDSESLARLIWGLAHTGLWGCFDEFNRLSANVLSQISATLEVAQAGIKKEDRTIELSDGELMCIDRDSAFFITLNPVASSGKKYGGRRRLPANLSQLFMPIAVVRVQVDAIVSESILSMSAYLLDRQGDEILKPGDLREIGKSICNWLDWMRSNATDAICEWDLRLVMAILRRLKLMMQGRRIQTIEELHIALFVAIDSEVRPRLGRSGADHLREGLISCKLHRERDPSESKAFKGLLKAKTLEMKLHHSEEQTQRAVDLRNQLEVHTGVLIHGPANSGKSTTWRLLHAALAPSVAWLPLNPKCWPGVSLFGAIDEQTNKWIDGPLTNQLRKALEMLNSREGLRQVWLILDGPIDPDWVESLNSVLDDNQVLTLSSGEHLYLSRTPGKSVKLLMETDDLSNASPATISRMGAVFHEISLNHDQENFESDNSIENWLVSDSRFMIVTGFSHDEKQQFINRSKKQSKISSLVYNCSPYTSCEHLLDLLTQITNISEPQVIILDNIHLINPEPGRRLARSFLELLRFVIIYGLYHRPDATFGVATCRTRVKFLVFVESLDVLNARIINQARILYYDCEKTETADAKCSEFDSILDYIDSCSTISTEASEFCDPEAKNKLIEYFSSKSWQICLFRNSEKTKQSLEILEGILESGPGNSRVVFILQDAEYRLLGRKSVSRLLHDLNGLLYSSQASNVRFIYISNNLYKNNGELNFWRAFGDVGRIKERPVVSIKDALRDKLSLDYREHEKSIEWVIKNVKFLIDKKSINPKGTYQFKLYLDIIARLIEKTFDTFQRDNRNLHEGMLKLGRYEQIIDEMKRNCARQEVEMAAKEREIKETMKLIDSTLIDFHEQKIQIEKLRGDQELKNREIQDKSQKVEVELREVQQLVDTSKSVIAGCLRPEALNEIRGFRSPPQTIKDILDALFILLSVNDNSWNSIKSYLANGSKLRDELTNYDFRQRLNAPLVSKAESFIRSKSNSFQPQQANRACKAIVPILDWIQATLEYGRVLQRLRPLDAEMMELEKSKVTLDSQTSELEYKLAELDKQIQQNNEKLNKLKSEFSGLQKVSEQIKFRLQRAESVHVDLREQSTRWQARSDFNHQYLDGINPFVHSFVAASALKSRDELSELVDLLKISDLKEYANMLNHFVSMICGKTHTRSDDFLKFIRSEETNKVLKLLLMKLHIEINQTEPLFLDVGSDEAQVGEMAGYLCYQSLLADENGKGLHVLKCNSWRDFNELAQMIELQLRLPQNELILIELPPEQSVFHLDIMDFVLEKLKSQSAAKLALFGRLDKLDESTRHLFHTVKLFDGSNGSDTSDEIKLKIVEKFSRLSDPQLVDSMQKLAQEIEADQAKVRSLEPTLLQRLVVADQEDEISEDVVQVLKELHEIGNELRLKLEEIEKKTKELREKQGKFAPLVDMAASFYLTYLSDLGKADKFYQMTLERYIVLLTRNGLSKLTEGIDFNHVINRTIQPMRPEFADTFRKKFVSQPEKTSEFQLKGALRSLIDQTEQGLNGKLMVILHDPAKSSPQLEIDEFFKQNRGSLSYEKLYATDESGEKLDRTLSKSRDSPQTRCVCLVNAHLATNWIKMNLLHHLTRKDSARFLVIIVGEAGDDGTNPYEQPVLDFAQVKYWHDELALTLKERFTLLTKSLFDSIKNCKLALNDDNFCILTKQLVLFHVVCQELAKPEQTAVKLQTKWSHCGYTFNYDQLSLAFKTLLRLAGYDASGQSNASASANDLRSIFCKHLEFIHYGGRMETLEDELLINNLIAQYLVDGDSAKVELQAMESR